MKNIKSWGLLIVLMLNLFSLTACNNVQSIAEETTELTDSEASEQVVSEPSEEQKGDDVEITLNIYNLNKETIYSEKIKTEKSNLLELMSTIDALKLKTEDSEGGKFIVSIMDISYDYGRYWNCYINGEILQENIGLYEIIDNDVVELRYEKVGE